MSREFDSSLAYEIAEDIYWIGMHLKGDPFQCHPYLIKNANESILVDPGSMLEFDEVVKKIKSLVDIKSIKYIILHHQDPDLCASVPELEKLIDRDDLEIVTHSRMSLLIKHYMVSSSYYEIDKHNLSLKTSSGKTLEFLTTPYCHSPGAFVTYEPITKTLFSGDIFGGIEHSWHFFADESYFLKAKLFHQEYMPSKDIFNYALSKIEKLDIELIAPQHGSIIQRQYIPKLIEDMKSLDCGLYIEQRYNAELLDTISKLQESQNTIKEQMTLMAQQSKMAEIGEMVQNIAHQWRQPLAILNTSLAILKEKNTKKELDSKLLEQKFQRMQNRLDYMSQTIDDFLNYNKPQKEKSRFKIYQLLQRALKIVSMTDENKKIKIEIKAVDKEVFVYGFFNDLTQVIVSILSNINDLAIHKDSIHIKIEFTKVADLLNLSIEDDCGGILQEHIGRIFDPYFTTKHQSMGTGLGLYIAKNILEKNMKGKISAKNIITSDGKITGAKFILEVHDE